MDITACLRFILTAAGRPAAVSSTLSGSGAFTGL
jgi:hypothetical protein